MKISGLPIAMVPCLHQCKVYIKRKLRVWRAQKCNFLVSAKTEPTVVGQQTTLCLAAPFGQAIEIFKINVYILRRLQVWRTQKCNFLVSAKIAQTGTGQETAPCLAAPYLASNRNFQNFGATYRHGTVFAPKQCLYCKEATSVESPIMQFPSQCKNRTDSCGSTNYPASCSAVFGKQ